LAQAFSTKVLFLLKMEYDVDAAIDAAGGLSTFQNQYTWFILGYPWVICGMQTLLFIFVTITPLSHKCRTPGHCEPAVFACDGAIFADDIRSSSVAEWDLRCNNAFWAPMIGSIFFCGFLVGVGSLGRMSDAYGRRKVFYLSLSLICFFSIWAPLFTGSYFWYAVSRFMIGAGVGGIGLASYVLNTEILPEKSRPIMVITSNSFFAVGIIAVTLLALVFERWRVLSTVVGLCGLPMFGYVWLPLIESPKWYATQPGGAALAHDVRCAISHASTTHRRCRRYQHQPSGIAHREQAKTQILMLSRETRTTSCCDTR